MAALCPLAWLALALLCATPAAAATEGRPSAMPLIQAGPAEVLVTLTCPEPAPSLTVAVDGALMTPITHETIGVAPPSVALVVDTSAQMESAGTPHSTRLRDAVTRAELLLAMVPPGAAVAVIVFDRTARVSLPMSTDRPALRAALAQILAGAPSPTEEPDSAAGAPSPTEEPDSAAGALPYALPEATRLGLEQLRGAPPGPQALVVFAAGTPGVEPMDTMEAPGMAMLVVGQGADLTPGAESEPGPLARFARSLGADYAPYHSADIAALPALNRGVERHFARLLVPGARLRLRLPTADLAPGAHLLSVAGCGAQHVAAFEVPRGLSLGSVGAGVALALAAVAAGAGVTARRYRQQAPKLAAPPVETATTRLRAAATITTARRSAMSAVELRLRAVVLDGRRRRLVPLEGRQWTVGSDPACTVCVEGEGIAALHARVSVAGGKLELTALDGSGRTRVGSDGRLLLPGAPEPLEPGDLVVIGQSTRLVIESAVDPVSPEGS